MSEQPSRLERELKEMLAVNPAPDLQARVRARAFSTPARRVPWFAWTSGVAAATAAVWLIAAYHHPKAPEMTSPAIAAEAEISPPAAVAESPIQVRQTRKVQKEAKSTNEVTTLVATAATTNALVLAAEIELPTLQGLELKSSIQPIPQPAPFALASLQPIKIEPPMLTVPTLE